MSTGDISDGYHTFDELYEHRRALFRVLVAHFEEHAWKTKQHAPGDDPMPDGYFLVGIRTMFGQVSYHEALAHWDAFDAKELEFAPPYDGYTSNDVIDRLNKWAGMEMWHR